MILISILLLLGFSLISTLKTGASRLDRMVLNKLVSHSKRYRFFRRIQKLFPKERLAPFEDFFSLSSIILLTLYVSFTIVYVSPPLLTALFAIFVFLTFHLIANQFPLGSFKLFSLPATLFLLILFPVVYPLVFLERKLVSSKKSIEPSLAAEKLKRRLLELLHDYELGQMLDPRDKKLVKSIAHFGDLVAREIMVPRVDILAISETTTVKESLKLFINEGYSRIPVYSETVDHIIGVLLYKDVMEFCFGSPDKDSNTTQKTPVKELISPIVYTPENKKIQDLFQEMRTQKTHSAIVVNEYGCTEGLITIEDILEELVGSEIFDEHDEEELESKYRETEDKSWIVSAKMSIVDAERKIGIHIPHDVEYETIAGYISSQTGMIPPPGTIIYGDQFQIQVLSSDKRQILKVKITPTEKEIFPKYH